MILLGFNKIPQVGLFSSDPWSRRAQGLEEAFRDLGVEVMQVIPWKVSRLGSTDKHEIVQDNIDLSSAAV